MSPMQLPYAQDEMDLQHLLEVAHRRRWMLAGVAIATTVCLWGWTLTRTPIYRGEFQVLIESIADVDPSQQLLRDNQIQLRSNFDYDTQIEVLQSPALLRPIAEELRDTFPEFTYAELKGNLTITRLRETKVLSVSYRDPDPDKIQAVLDVVAEHYLQYSFEQRQTSLQQGVQFVETQLPELRDRVNSLQQRLERFRQDYSLIDPESRGIEISQLITSIEEQQQSTQTQLSEAESLYRAIQSQLGYSPDEALAASALSESSRYQAILNEIQTVEAQIATESARFLPDTPNVQVLEDRRQTLLPLLDQEAERILGQQLSNPLSGNLTSISIDLSRQLINTANEVQVLQARERALAQVEQRLKQDFDLVPALARQYTDLQRELDIATNSLNRFLSTRESLQIEGAQQSIPWQLIAEPTAANSPISPNVPRSLMLGAIAGVLLGAGAAFVTDKLDMVFHTPDDLKTFTRLPLLGIVPFVREPNLLPDVDRHDGETSEHSLSEDEVKPLDATGDRHAYHYRSSPFLESFRSLYANIRFLSADNAIRSVVISSAVPAEGKSTIALNLARAAAVMGQRVLLVDADLRLPQIHERLRLANLRGLSNVIAGEAELQSSIQASGVHDNLFVLTAGRIPPDPIQLLSSHKMQHIIEAANQDFDLVLYDVPPLLGFADSSLLSAQTDGMILTVGLGTTSRTELKQALDTLEVSPVCLLGIVANGIKPHTTHSYGHYRYNHYYNYYTKGDRQPKTWLQTVRDRIQTALPSQTADSPDQATDETTTLTANALEETSNLTTFDSSSDTGDSWVSPSHLNGAPVMQTWDVHSGIDAGIDAETDAGIDAGIDAEQERFEDYESDRSNRPDHLEYTVIAGMDATDLGLDAGSDRDAGDRLAEADLDVNPDYWDEELDGVRVPSFEELLNDTPITGAYQRDGAMDEMDNISEFGEDALPDLSPSLDSDESKLYHVSISSDTEQDLDADLSTFDESAATELSDSLRGRPSEAIADLEATPELSGTNGNSNQTTPTSAAPESRAADESTLDPNESQSVLSRESQQSWLKQVTGINLRSLLNGEARHSGESQNAQGPQNGEGAIATPDASPNSRDTASWAISDHSSVTQDADHNWVGGPSAEPDWYGESEPPFTPRTSLSADAVQPKTTIPADADADSDIVQAALTDTAALTTDTWADDATSIPERDAGTGDPAFDITTINESADATSIDSVDPALGLSNGIANHFDASDWQSSDGYSSRSSIDNPSEAATDSILNHSQTESSNQETESNSTAFSELEPLASSTADDEAWGSDDAAGAELSQMQNRAPSDIEPLASSGTDRPSSEPAHSENTARPAAGYTPFLEAVVVAKDAIAAGQSATTAEDWLQLAAQWQRASELMGMIAENDENYAIAQQCQELYRNNSDYARQRGLA